jgi:hypothetical protein
MSNKADDLSRDDHARFRTTRWSLIVAAHEGTTAEVREALAWLCRDYWYPLYVFIRRRSSSARSRSKN